ncbi:Interleukin-17 family, partial [Trinorchestia longiramus]
RHKRQICCNTEGICRTCLDGMDAQDVVDHYFDFFADIPRSLVEFSVLGFKQKEHCENLDIPLFPVYLKQILLSPSWIRDISHLGWCPSVLTTKDLGPNSFPAKLIEVKCLCERKKCSARGTDFRCVSVHRMIATWKRFSTNGKIRKPFSPTMTRVRIGCVCAQRPALWGGEMDSIFAL